MTRAVDTRAQAPPLPVTDRKPRPSLQARSPARTTFPSMPSPPVTSLCARPKLSALVPPGFPLPPPGRNHNSQKAAGQGRGSVTPSAGPLPPAQDPRPHRRLTRTTSPGGPRAGLVPASDVTAGSRATPRRPRNRHPLRTADSVSQGSPRRWRRRRRTSDGTGGSRGSRSSPRRLPGSGEGCGGCGGVGRVFLTSHGAPPAALGTTKMAAVSPRSGARGGSQDAPRTHAVPGL